MFEFISRLFRGPQGGQFVSEPGASANLQKQTEMSPMTLTELRKYGVTDDSRLKLEYFFYTNTAEKAASLSAQLTGLGYSSEHGRSAGDKRLFIVTGWTSELPMTDEAVVSWTRQMVELGVAHDCDFDGWGTHPPSAT